MNPSEAFSGILTLPFWVLVLIIGLIVAGFRWLVENLSKAIAYIFPDEWEPFWQWLWREAILPTSPLVVGGLIGLYIIQYPYPQIFNKSMWGRIFVGIIAGLFSAYCYPRIKYYLEKISLKWNVEANKAELKIKEILKEQEETKKDLEKDTEKMKKDRENEN